MSNLFFAKTHEWVNITGDTATVGISDYAQKELGDIVFVELPSPGAQLVQSTQFGTIESTKAASELYAPLSGEVIETNEELTQSPQLVNEDAMGKGWLVKIKLSDPSQKSVLLDESAYGVHIGAH
ncbi:MAG: glycine cleavage system protein GcvH [Candidatus Omnitrophica bacterium]|nr:glycine cleavage system protein GcvH [Candidatus Omnitrophota bacterium]